MATPSTTMPAPPPDPDQEMKDLIAKHRKQIDAVLVLDSRAQMQAVAQLGIDPVALEKHYSNLVEKNDQLVREDDVANRKTAITGLISTAAGLAVAFAFRKNIAESVLVQGFTVGLSGLAAGLGGTFVGSRLFSGRIRDEGKQLAIEARGALERELAVAFENRERDKERDSAPAAPSAPAQSQAQKVSPRDQSYATQATAEKTAANLASQQRA